MFASSGRADHHHRHGGVGECPVFGHGARVLDQAGVPVTAGPGGMVRRPAPQDQGNTRGCSVLDTHTQLTSFIAHIDVIIYLYTITNKIMYFCISLKYLLNTIFKTNAKT